MFEHPLTSEEISALLLSAKVGCWSTGLLLIPGIILSWALTRFQFWGKSAIESILYMPLVLPPTVTGYILLLAFGKNGFLGHWLHEIFGLTLAFTWKGAVIASMVMSLPLMVQPIKIAMNLIEPKLEQAASTLGANPFMVFLTVTLPLTMPGIINGVILAFARSLGEFGATITFVGNVQGETRTLPLAFYTYTQVPGGEEPMLRLIIISIVFAFGALMASDWLTHRARRKQEN